MTPTTSMNAAVIDALGPASSIRAVKLPWPRLGATDVLVRAEAMGVNHVDLFVRSGAFRTDLPFPFVIGRDIVGTVVATGTAVNDLPAGKRVWSNSLGYDGRQGSFSEYVAVPRDRAYLLPDEVATDRAVSVLHAMATAYLGLCREGAIGPGDVVVVGGAGGAVGSAAVQLAAHLGAHVIASCSTGDADWAKSCGAEETIDYRHTSVNEAIAALVPAGLDLHWDCSGHVELAEVVPQMSVGGKIIVSAGLTATSEVSIGDLYTHDLSIHGFAITHASVADLREAAEIINEMLIDPGIKTRIGPILPLSQAAEAHRLLETQSRRSLGGKIIIRPDGASADD